MTRRVACCVQALSIDVDVKLFLERITETGNPMVQRHGTDREHGILNHGKERAGRRDGRSNPRRRFAQAEPVGGEKRRGSSFMRMTFLNLDRKRIAVDEVPSIALQLPGHIGDEPRRAVKPESLPATQRDPQNSIEPDEMIHVRMGDEQI